MNQIREYIRNEWDIKNIVSIEQLKIGFMNLIYKVSTDSEVYYLRIFQSDSQLNNIYREIWITNYIAKHCTSSFTIPTAMKNKSGDFLSAYLDTGFYACFIPEIPGQHPDITNETDMYASGKALGELNHVLRSLPIDMIADKNPSYADLLHFHPSVTDFIACVEELSTSSENKQKIRNLYEEMKSMIDVLYKQLPMQYIHGDYTNGNRLIHNGKISGILDFEFFCWDVRCMDLAIGLGGGPSALWESDDTLVNFNAFGKGYMEESPLKEQELLAIPSLIRLRRLAMFIYFMGRYYDGHDTEQFMSGIVKWLLLTDSWIVQNNDRLLMNIQSWTRMKE